MTGLVRTSLYMVVWISMQLIIMNWRMWIFLMVMKVRIAYATGCTNPNACNTTTGVINVISECDFPPINYFCDYLDGDDGEYVISCINDSDGDGVCDENEIEGCT